MRWKGRKGSSNVEDRRGRGGSKIAIGGLGAVILIVVTLLFGGNPLELLNQIDLGGGNPAYETSAPPTAEQDELASFVSVVLADTEQVWGKLFSERGQSYRKPTLVMFTNTVQSACGSASSATGPFYCPADEKIYIDLSFYNDLKDKFQAPGDFAMAYVIAHEVGHHVQNLLGVSDRMAEMRSQLSEKEYNQYSVKVELQADFYAGVWAYHNQDLNNVLEPGDIEEALAAANAIGDDRLQKQSQGKIMPDSFTHGTSAQRMHWFNMGYKTGDVSKGDTFNAPSP
jgi:uncharacterized protein